ncbi:MAG: LEA14-like dessication related protein [Pseudoalteromonas distincta]|jgi:LEA14-like dessication related protein
MKGYRIFKLTIGSLILISGCMGGPKSPSFINLDNVKILSANARKVVLQGDAIFNNPNAIAGKLTKTDIHIKINDVDITDIEQTTSIDVPKNSNFTVPVNFSFNPKKLTQDNDGFLQNAIKSFLSNELTIEYAGYVTIEVLGIGFDVPIDYTEKVSMGLN